MRECGRSMVEMLGVLAIIGVLSVGAIAGYSKAMLKYKLNKQATIISDLLGYMMTNPRTFSSNSSYTYAPLLKKLNLCTYESTNSEFCTDSFGHLLGGEMIFRENNRSYMYLSIFLIYSSEEKSNSSNIVTQCVNLIKVGKDLSFLIDYIMIDGFSQQLYGDTECVKHPSLTHYCLKNMTVQHIYDVCRSVKQAKLYRVLYYFNTGKI